MNCTKKLWYMKALGSQERTSVHCSSLFPSPSLLQPKKKKKEKQKTINQSFGSLKNVNRTCSNQIDSSQSRNNEENLCVPLDNSTPEGAQIVRRRIVGAHRKRNDSQSQKHQKHNWKHEQHREDERGRRPFSTMQPSITPLRHCWRSSKALKARSEDGKRCISPLVFETIRRKTSREWFKHGTLSPSHTESIELFNRALVALGIYRFQNL